MIIENSFELSIENKKEENSENDIRIAYIKKEEVPKIEIINSNLMNIDGDWFKIDDYIKQINDYIKKIKEDKNNLNDFLDDYDYNHCRFCNYNLNIYFCENCQKNICDKCSEACKDKKHKFLFLNEMKDIYKNYIQHIEVILNSYIIPIKNITHNEEEHIEKNDKNSINMDKTFYDNYPNFYFEGDNHEDIFLIYEIISTDYDNYFHYKNIEQVYKYSREKYFNISNINYEGNGKKIYKDRTFYIGQFKNGIQNGKGIYYSKNG